MAVVVQRLPEAPEAARDPLRPAALLQPRVRAPREEKDEEGGEPGDEDDLEDDELLDVFVAADREQEAGRDEDERAGGADDPLHEDRPRGLALRLRPRHRRVRRRSTTCDYMLDRANKGIRHDSTC